MHKVDGPDVVWVLWPEADDRRIVMIEPLALLMVFGKLQALFAPYPFNLFVIYSPAFRLQQLAYLSIAVSAILFCQTNKSQAQLVVIILAGGLILLR